MLHSLFLPHKSQDTTQGPINKDLLSMLVIGIRRFFLS